MAGTFSNEAAVAKAIGRDPQKVVELMKQHLTQQQLTGFEGIILPAPSAEEAAATLRRAKDKLLEQGLSAKHPVIAAINGSLA